MAEPHSAEALDRATRAVAGLGLSMAQAAERIRAFSEAVAPTAHEARVARRRPRCRVPWGQRELARRMARVKAGRHG